VERLPGARHNHRKLYGTSAAADARSPNGRRAGAQATIGPGGDTDGMLKLKGRDSGLAVSDQPDVEAVSFLKVRARTRD